MSTNHLPISSTAIGPRRRVKPIPHNGCKILRTNKDVGRCIVTKLT